MRTRRVAAFVALGMLGSAAAWADEEQTTCLGCHAEEEEEDLSAPVEEWRRSVHAAADVSCDACHGGDPFEEDEELSMDEETAHFLGVPVWSEEPKFCGSCHEEIADAFRLSVMAGGIPEDQEIAVCTTCHMYEGHATNEADPREILTADRCGGCHEPERAIEWRELLEQTNQQLARAHSRVKPIRRMIATAIVDRELEEIRRRVVVTAHTYDRDQIVRRAALTRHRLAGVDPVVDELSVEARFRRRMGVGVVAGLIAAWLGVIRLGRNLRKRSSG